MDFAQVSLITRDLGKRCHSTAAFLRQGELLAEIEVKKAKKEEELAQKKQEAPESGRRRRANVPKGWVPLWDGVTAMHNGQLSS